ncbi:hypothetical protein [Vibrio gallaecicus]|nr:hypothetical protein [Vibrio gallaecicus]MDN3615645.1 hypothetical protein [Vibrio gallaecicus]
MASPFFYPKPFSHSKQTFKTYHIEIFYVLEHFGLCVAKALRYVQGLH